jgi:uncharacterized protein (DUF2141 family)
VILDVAPGVYAVQAFHEETDQGVVDQDLFGIPKERVGFSNEPPMNLRGPGFQDAAFQVNGSVAALNVTLHAIFGRLVGCRDDGQIGPSVSLS